MNRKWFTLFEAVDMFFAQLRTARKTLRYQLMLWNAVVVIIASLGAMAGLRVGIQYFLLAELDQTLRKDVEEIKLTCLNFRPDNPRLKYVLDRKASVHVQNGWFVELLSHRDEADAVDAPDEKSPKTREPTSPSTRDDLLATVQDNDSSSISRFGRARTSSGQIIFLRSGNGPPELSEIRFPDDQPQNVGHYRVFAGEAYSRAARLSFRVRVGAAMDPIDRTMRMLDRTMLLMVLFSIIIAPLGGYWLAGRATSPLSKIISLAERLRPSHLDERLPLVGTNDELDQLSQAINSMLDRIADYISKNKRLLANSAHELRTPIAALRSKAEVALAKERPAAEYQATLSAIVKECGNLESLVNQLLLLAETENIDGANRRDAVDLGKLVASACEMFEAVAEERGTRLSFECSGTTIVDGNRLHLRQLVNNLLDNAFKFTPEGGEVSVRLKGDADMQWCNLTVTDTGIGISESESQRVFERFYRGDPIRRKQSPTRGTGLGLSICQAVAESHGGTIGFESQPNQGTCFTVTLPLSANAPINNATCT